MVIYNLIKKERTGYIFLFLILFFFSRFIISYFLDIKLNGLNFGYHLLHQDLLHYDLLKSLIYLHSQPPLFNLYGGILLKIANGNLELVGIIFWFFNSLLSIGIIYYSYLISKFFNFSCYQSFLLLSVLILNPNIIFYENIFSYHQLLTFLFFQGSYIIFKFFETEKFKFEIFFYLNLSLLGLIWSVFQPILIIVVFFIIRFLTKTKISKNLFITLFIFLISSTPHIKNKIIFDSFTSSTWAGGGFSTVFNPEWRIFCGDAVEKKLYYNELYEKKYNKFFTHASLVSEKALYNSVGLVYQDNYCFKLTLEKIIKEPSNYFASRLKTILATHGKFPFDFTPKPKGWDLPFYENLFKLKDYKIYKQFILLFINLIIYCTMIFMIFFSNFNHKLKSALFLISIIYLYLFSVSYLFSCCEQERMLYTGYIKEVLFIIFIIHILSAKFSKISK